MTARVRLGISPVIATVIIVAVAVAISLAVASWLMGLWGGFTEYEALRVLPLSRLYFDSDSEKWILELHLANEGSAPANIILAEVQGETVELDATVQPGETTTITIPLPGDYSGYGSVSVKVYTAGGGVYAGIVSVGG